jgi:hypothetical protein
MSSELNAERNVVMTLFQTARRAVREIGPSCSAFRRLSFVFQGSGRSYVLSDGTSLDSSGAEVSLTLDHLSVHCGHDSSIIGYSC